jgi:hypothetical protein
MEKVRNKYEVTGINSGADSLLTSLVKFVRLRFINASTTQTTCIETRKVESFESLKDAKPFALS